MLPIQRWWRKPTNPDPVERTKNQFPAYAANHSDDGERPKHWNQDNRIFYYRANTQVKANPEKPASVKVGWKKIKLPLNGGSFCLEEFDG